MTRISRRPRIVQARFRSASARITTAIAALSVATLTPMAAVARPPATRVPATASRAPAALDEDRLDVNNLDMAVTNHDSFAFDVATNTAGLVYPRGSGKTAVFAAGLWVGAKVAGQLRVALGEYYQEFVPGPMAGGTYQPDQPSFRNYRIDRGDVTSDDYLNWPVSQGAPTDALGDPLLFGDALIWSACNDANPAAHMNSDGSTEPLGVEIRQSSFAFNRSGPLGNTIFFIWNLTNAGANTLDSTFVSIWCDPDLGGFTDDLVGCDTTRALGYCYNATNADAVYGSTPPAVGFALLQGPMIQGGLGVTDTLGMTAFTRYLGGSDPENPQQVFDTMRGVDAYGAPIHEYDDPLQPVTTFPLSGDPVTQTGWVDALASDRRFMMSMGPFSMPPGDTQMVIAALLVGAGSDRLASITDLRSAADSARAMYRNAFEGPQLPTAVEIALLEAAADAGTVRLSWAVADAGRIVSASVDRRQGEAAWTNLGEPTLEGGERLAYVDRTVAPGATYRYRLTIRDRDGETTTNEVSVTVPEAPIPAAPRLDPAVPNPSSGGATISYALPRPGRVRIEVFDVSGRTVAIVRDRTDAAGTHRVRWGGTGRDGRSVSSGVYYLRLVTEEGTRTRRLVIAR